MRLFVALDLPWTLRESLCDLGTGLPGIDWVPPENFHVTLRFIGEVHAHEAEEIDLALAAIEAPGFDLTLSGVGITEKAGRISSLWAGVERSQALDHLRGKVETALLRSGHASERRRFSPHVTLARPGQPADPKVAGWIQAHNLFRPKPVRIEHFTLFSSVLGADQAFYTAEVEYALRQA